MSDILKLKVCVGDSNIELEGEGNLVHTIFSELRQYGLGKLSVPILVQSKSELSKETKCQEITSEDDKSTNPSGRILDTAPLPQIATLVIKNLPKTETEWILIYALYASEQGTKVFEESDLRQAYQDSGRWNESRRKNFVTNLNKAVAVDWFTVVNDSEYSLLPAGKDAAYEILQRTPGSNGTKKAKKSANSAKATYNFVDLKLNEEQRQEFKQYLQSFPSANNMERAVLIAYKLTQYGILEFDENTIFTALRIADLSASYDLSSSLSNAKNKKNYFISGSTSGTYKLHHLGEDHAKELEKARGTE